MAYMRKNYVILYNQGQERKICFVISIVPEKNIL